MELHNKVPGDMVATIFLDGAFLCEDRPVGSCGVGLLVGPLKLELVRHQAKNQFTVGLRQ